MSHHTQLEKKLGIKSSDKDKSSSPIKVGSFKSNSAATKDDVLKKTSKRGSRNT